MTPLILQPATSPCYAMCIQGVDLGSSHVWQNLEGYPTVVVFVRTEPSGLPKAYIRSVKTELRQFEP